MNLTKEERQRKAYEIFNEVFKIDLQNYSPEQKRIAIDELNSRLKKAIEDEKEKNRILNLEIAQEKNNIIELMNELNDQA